MSSMARTALLMRHSAPQRDRFGVFLAAAVAVHAAVIFGVGFNLLTRPEPTQPQTPSLEITLVQTRSEKTPDDYAYLAQANQDGGGNTKERVRAETLFPALAPSNRARVTSPAPPVEATDQRAYTRRELMAQTKAKDTMQADVFPAQKNSDQTLNAAQLINRSMEIASIEMELGHAVQAYAKLPRPHVITASTKDAKDVAYMDAWRQKVERIGNLNYPDAAKRAHLSGSLLLDVALNRDGTLAGIEVVKSSGHLVLDDAAREIVRRAAPYAPFPEAMAKEYNVFHIIRTWRFINGRGMAMD